MSISNSRARLSVFALAAALALSATSAQAAAPTSQTSAYARPTPASYDTKTPDFVSFSVADYDFDKDTHKETVDLRLEYRWGVSLLPMMGITSMEHDFQLHPAAGIEVTGNGATFTSAGLDLDIPVGQHWIFTWGEAVGYYNHGNSQSLGYPMEFRSQIEAGWRFDNQMRVTGYISHLSNAGIGDNNPGAEVLGLYWHVPFKSLYALAK